MDKNTLKPLTIGVNSRFLFDLHEEHAIYEEHGVTEYEKCQISRESSPAQPGQGFELIKKLCMLRGQNDNPLVEIVILSRNSPTTGLRLLHSTEKLGLPVRRAVFTTGKPVYRYLEALSVDLFLSTEPTDVVNALSRKIPAAALVPGAQKAMAESRSLCFAFDADAVIFGKESEILFRQKGLAEFNENEQRQSKSPLGSGPFRHVLEQVCRLKEENCTEIDIRTAIVTARSAPAHERLVRTLNGWGLEVDELILCAGKEKGPMLNALEADIFFDDSMMNCMSATKCSVMAGHVPVWGEAA